MSLPIVAMIADPKALHAGSGYRDYLGFIRISGFRVILVINTKLYSAYIDVGLYILLNLY